MAGARAEDRRRLTALAVTGSPEGAGVPFPAVQEARANADPKPAFSAVSKKYLETFAVSHLKPSTRIGYEHVLRGLLIPHFGSMPVDTITALHVRELDAELVAKKAKPSTRRNMQTVLRSVLCRYAVEAEILEVPPKLPRLPKVGEQVVDVLTSAELKQVLAAAPSEHRLAFLLASHAGLRAGEVRGLRWRDVDLELGRLVVRQSVCRGFTGAPKSGHARIVPLTDELKLALEALKRGRPDSPVSLTTRGKQWGQFSLRKAFLAACNRAGLEAWRFHDLRHYFVTALLRAGAPARSVQQLAGHAHLTTTQRYAHLVENDLEAAIRRLGVTVG